ncbi:MAG: FtsX-like permease family protein [Cyclobacteriaceae bacterium]|nr:FtsX-like permease family protein [Cyclobacteriaceae bacterium HetDA_MAG_MS6]
MAWRDSRKSRGKLLLFIMAISLGIAALVGITSFRENLLTEINDQAKSLLGADVAIRGNRPLPDSLFYQFQFITGDDSREAHFSSMVYFPRTAGTRLTQVRALQGAYPYYGEIETEPARASRDFRKDKAALVDEKLMIQFDVQLGDSIQVGKVKFEIVGKIKKIPGQTSIGASVAPVVYIPYQFVETTGLIQKGSRINYINYFQFHPDLDTTNLWSKAVNTTESKGFDVETIDERKRETGRAFKDLSSFLELIAFTALLLGCLGVASSIYVYVKSKNQTVAILRCLGMKARQAIGIYLIQVALFGLIGAIVGSLIGMVIHLYLPEVAKDFVPVELTPTIYWPAIIAGLGIGICISILFGMLSLVGLRNISPLSAIRVGFEKGRRFDPLVVMICLGLVIFLFLAIFWQIRDAEMALSFTAILAGTLAVLFGIGKGLSWLIKRSLPASLPYVWRQGLSNLHRPNNQTVILIITLGLGTAFLATLYFMQDLLIQRVSLAGENERPNTILFDIQTNQKEELKALTLDYDLPIMQDVPVVTMRVKEINGLTKDDAWNDSTVSIPDWAYNREYRVTYRDSLIDSETISEGEWIGEIQNPNDSIFVSVAKGFAENIGLKLGDELLFNVQGALMKTYVSSFRDIDWNRVQTNFLVLFPKGILEKAPQFHVLITRIDKNDVSARYQQAVVRLFPNVSIIDLELILKTLEEILGKVAFVIRFMALFSIGTGLIVMISSIILSKFQRMRENVLLRTLGASRNQLWKIIAAEYFFLGSLGALSGVVLAVVFASLLGVFMFELTFVPNGWQMLIIFFGVALLSVVIGLFNSRDVIRQSPLEVLRREG